MHACKDINGLDVIIDNQVFTPVAQQKVNLSLGFGNVLTLYPVDCVYFFPGALVHKMDAADVAGAGQDCWRSSVRSGRCDQSRCASNQSQNPSTR